MPPITWFWPELKEIYATSSETVTVDRKRLNTLLGLFLSCWEFDQTWYLSQYPDIAAAIEDGHFGSAWEHFRKVGYFEGRLPTRLQVDEDWYLKTYPDIAKAVIDGHVKNSYEHFMTHGQHEGRLGTDPHVDPSWYQPRYLPSMPDADADTCRRHFVDSGYRDGCVPSAPK